MAKKNKYIATLGTSEDRKEAWDIAHAMAAQITTQGQDHLAVDVVKRQGTYQVELYAKEKS